MAVWLTGLPYYHPALAPRLDLPRRDMLDARMSSKPTDVVSASEIASWAWCPESWRLVARGEEPENKVELARGKRFHERTSTFEVWSRRAVSLGLWLCVLAMVLAALWYVLFRGAE
jgi:hypothetical protein